MSPAEADEIRTALRGIRARARARQAELLDEAIATMRDAGFTVTRCSGLEVIVPALLAILPPGAAVVSHPSRIGRRCGVDAALAAQGRAVTTLPGDQNADGAGSAPDPDHWRRRLLAADAGITGATALIADTGSLVLAEERGFGRAASNVPPLHVALVPGDSVVETLRDGVDAARGYAVLHFRRDAPRYVSFISGPSKTADIGFTLVRGMHGPRAVHVLICDEPGGGRAGDDDEAWLLP